MPDAVPQSQRLFIALPCPLTPSIESALEALRAAQQDSASGLRVVNADTLHITLSFLGSVATGRIAEVEAAMAELRALPALQLAVSGAGHFPTALWLGVRPDAALTELARRCEVAMHALGFEPDARPYHPHVTVARLKPRPQFDCKAWAHMHRNTAWTEYAAREVHLYRSEPLADGARYGVIHSVALR